MILLHIMVIVVECDITAFDLLVKGILEFATPIVKPETGVVVARVHEF